jgi:hypothetical protein
MTNHGTDDPGVPFADDDEGAEEVDGPSTAEGIADEVKHDIHLGHIQDDVSHVLEERFEKAGITLRPEEVDDLAEEIERDAST